MITKEEVLQAQQKWGEAIVSIGKLKNDPEAAEKKVEDVLHSLYGFGERQVLFKPTKCMAKQFRNNVNAAKSYFIGRNPEYEEDKGFALQPWVDVRFENEGITEGDNNAIAMGNYYFTTEEGEKVKVEYSFGYFRSEDGSIKINLHHSSIPFKTELV